jgi:hypothetical protein
MSRQDSRLQMLSKEVKARLSEGRSLETELGDISHVYWTCRHGLEVTRTGAGAGYLWTNQCINSLSSICALILSFFKLGCLSILLDMVCFNISINIAPT